MFKNKFSICFFLISLAVLLYFFYVVVPFGDRYDFFHENKPPEQSKILIFFLMSTPVLIGYIGFAIINFKKILYLKTLSYPLAFANIYFGSFFCLLIMGGATLWLMIGTIFIPFIMIPLSLIFGIIGDVKYSKKNKLSHDNE